MKGMLGRAKEFLTEPGNTVLVCLLIALGVVAYLTGAGNAPAYEQSQDTKVAVHFFYTQTCPYCALQKPIIEELQAERKDVAFFAYDASTPQGSEVFRKMMVQAGKQAEGVPTIIVGGTQVYVGLQSKEALLQAIEGCNGDCGGEKQQNAREELSNITLPVIGQVDLTAWSLPALAVIIGLVDGFNPCALWVLIFMVTLLLGQKSKKKIWLVIGSFVTASAVSYFVFMTAWLNLFLLIGYIRILTMMIGLFAIGAGVLQLKEYVTTKGELVCSVQDPEGHKKTMSRIQRIIAQPVTWGVIASVIGLAFVVNAIEFVCSAALPAVFTQVLALSDISTVEHYLYILLYVFFYMLDHIIIFGMAGFALSSGFAQKYSRFCRLAGGVIMLLIGALLLFAPHLLR